MNNETTVYFREYDETKSITADRDTINTICIAFFEASERFKDMGADVLSNKYLNFANMISLQIEDD